MSKWRSVKVGDFLFERKGVWAVIVAVMILGRYTYMVTSKKITCVYCCACV